MNSFIIPTLVSNPDLLKKCLHSILTENFNFTQDEIIVVASGENCELFIDDHHGLIKISKFKNRLHFAEACNIGVKLSKGDTFILINDDVELDPLTIYKMKESMDHNKADILGVRLLYENGTIQHGGVGYDDNQIPNHRFHGEPADFPEANVSEELSGVTYALVMIKRSVWESLGGLDENYLSCFEDVDFNLRALEKGYKIWYDGTLKATHYGSQSQSQNVLNMARNFRRLRSQWIETRRIAHLLCGQKTRQPYWMAIATTWKCPLRCEVCNIWKNPDHTMIDFKRLRKGLSHKFYDSVMDVSLFGGEPFLHPDLVDISKWCMDRFNIRSLGIVTSGTGTKKETIMELAKVVGDKLTLCVSVEGDEAYHNSRRGKGTYKRALEALEVGAEYIHSPRPTRISTTILPESIHQIEHVLELAFKYHADIALRAGVIGSYFNNSGNSLNPERFKWTKESLLKLGSYVFLIPTPMQCYPFFLFGLYDWLKNKNHPACTCHFDTIIVDPKCGVSVCHEIPSPWTIESYPDAWAKDDKWMEISEQWCFHDSCFIDGPYSLSLLRGSYTMQAPMGIAQTIEVPRNENLVY